MPKLHPVHLTPEQRELLQTRLRQGGLPARVLARIRTLLWSDDGLTDAAIAERLETSTSSVERPPARSRVRQRIHILSTTQAVLAAHAASVPPGFFA